MSSALAASQMYPMKPIYQDSKVETSSCMYNMKSLHSSEYDVNDPDMKTLVEKDKKISKDLQSLSEDVKGLCGRLGHTFGDPPPEGIAKTSTSSGNVGKINVNLPDGITDVVISNTVSRPAFSAVLIAEYLSARGVNLATASQKHSSLTADVPCDFLAATGGSRGRIDINVDKIVFSFVWKEELFSPSLMVSSHNQTKIRGDGNIGRYLCRMLCPSLYPEEDAETASEIDKWIDTASQFWNGNAKEKDSALKSMNSHLGRNSLFCKDVCLADIAILACLLGNVQDVPSLPKNVKKWFQGVVSCFPITLSKFTLPSGWTTTQ